MYENKILVNIYMLSLSKKFELFIPINEKIGNIIKLLNNVSNDSIDYSKSNRIMNGDTGECYKYNLIIRNSDIKNGTNLIFI